MSKAENKKLRRTRVLAKGRCPDHVKRLAVPGKTKCQECLDRKKTWNISPEGKSWYGEYFQSPEYKEYRSSYKKRPHVLEAKSAYMKEYLPEYNERRRLTDTNYKLARNLRVRLWWALHTQGATKQTKTLVLLGCPLDDFQRYIEALWEPGMSWSNWGKGPGTWQIDHIRPLSSFDLSSEAELREACLFINLQPLWHEDHIQKTIADNSRIC